MAPVPTDAQIVGADVSPQPADEHLVVAWRRRGEALLTTGGASGAVSVTALWRANIFIEMEGAPKSLADGVVAAVLGPAGRTDRALRVSAMQRAASIAQAEPGPELAGGGGRVEALEALVDNVARHAYRITDEEIATLLAAGYTEDALFDVIVAAAVGAGVARRDVGLEAIAAWERTNTADGGAET